MKNVTIKISMVADWEGTPAEFLKMKKVDLLHRLEILVRAGVILESDLEKWMTEQVEAFEAQEGYKEAAAEYLVERPEFL